jgi:hypothetical protein
VPNRNLVHEGLLELINQTENITRSITSTTQQNGGEATTIRASAIHDAMFLSNNIQRRFRCGETTIAERSRQLPR